MPAFTVIAQTGEKIKIWAQDEAWLIGSLTGAYNVESMEPSPLLQPHEYDFIIPKNVQALHDRLRELAGIPRLDQMMRGAEYLHSVHGTVTFIASDPEDGAYLICKYWDTEEDEQKYFGCEAGDLRQKTV